MNKYIQNIKEQAKEESMKAGLVILGALSGIVSAGLLRKLTKDKPQLNSVVEYGYPALLAGGGFLLATATPKGHKAKYFGYGLQAAGVVEGIKLIPIAKDYLAGILGSTEIPAADAFFTESEARQKLLGNFGSASLPIGKATLTDVPSYETRLPELEGSDDDNQNLGYNGSYTDETDNFHGIL